MLLPLFEGSTGPLFLGRILEGVDAGRLVLLRKVLPRDIVGLELTIGVVRSLAHPAVAKVISLVRCEESVYVASEHIDGVTVHELLEAARRDDSQIAPRVATRIVHDALVAADEADVLLAWKQSPRCLHADTIWLAAYGSTLLSEPGVADYLHRWEPHAEPSGGDASRGAILTDIRTAIDLLRNLTSSDRDGTNDDERIPAELQLLFRPDRSWTSRRELADALAELPQELFGTESEVAEVVSALVGTTLEMRRFRALPLDAIRDQCGDDDETACFVSPLANSAGKRLPKPPAPPPSATSTVVSGERPVAPVYINEDIEVDVPDDDDQEVTTAFRPSQIPRSSHVEARIQPVAAPKLATVIIHDPSEVSDTLIETGLARGQFQSANEEQTGITRRQRARHLQLWLALCLFVACATAAYLLR